MTCVIIQADSQMHDARIPSDRVETLSDTVAIIGAGFSTVAGLPSTAEITTSFLHFKRDSPTPRELQPVITRHLLRFWNDVFAYEEGGIAPAFEDHFTTLDMAANTGHNVGQHYPPARLRALRRISIHRVLDILDVEYRQNAAITKFIRTLAASIDAAVVSLNWDIVVENHLERAALDYSYLIPGQFLHGQPQRRDGLPLIKLHGSANWHYCDSCRTVLFGKYGKTALMHRTFLEPNDFRTLGEDETVVERVARAQMGGIPCTACHAGKLTARVATFSYSKAFDYFLFHAAWDLALQKLRKARRWIFIGYSLPEADFAFKHLLKTAEMASLDHGPKEVRVVSKDCTGVAEERYRRFFGSRLIQYWNEGFEAWVKRWLKEGSMATQPTVDGV